ncbi:MAG: DUF3800 domain-containing protein [Elusimicrobiota bacterium]|nr:DUF3800 domain-containing protein [Elusimicrobiota bacterium]
MKFLYIFLDEGGNLDFSDNGTNYFILTSISKERPFEAYKEMSELKYDLIESGLGIEYFHASEDRQVIRDKVFGIIRNHLAGVRIDSLIVEKRKTGKALQLEEKFFPEMMGYLLKYILNGFKLSEIQEVLIFTDSIPVKRKREAIEKAIRKVLKRDLPPTAKYRIFHHASKSNFDLQIIDYCNWAIYRKWEANDDRSYLYIKSVIKSEFDIFQAGKTYYY